MNESEALVREYWRRMGTNDFDLVSGLLHGEFTVEWPQSGERIRGAQNYARMNSEYPAAGSWTFDIQRLVASDGEAVTHTLVSDGSRQDEAVSFFTVRDGLIVQIVEFWPEPFAPDPHRGHLTERF